MILLTDDLRDLLLANGRQRDVDHVPVVKFFDPLGAGTWLATELDADNDTLFGLADLGFGCPELGSFSLSELTSVRLPFGMGIERDILFEAAFPLSVYAEAARQAGSIVESERLLTISAAPLRGGH
ncbi:DUF2958 domain-containing protein [Tistrella sp. BH-R2-4]|jgi:hypothetical protein|uniref:DUF2958 domain-containing protein n=1 Tax=Tistrella arctica TaxID=3133430 RepID=A0ABU9YQW2_9PROT|nr:DUF2958 domain-containing protein [Mesorhizobium sediminum]NRC54260.1 DUF2958 domain-containing protein [Mesorhizobium sediminum]